MRDDLRGRTVASMEAMGFHAPTHLPLLDEVQVRSAADVVDRIAVLSAVAAVAHGCPRPVATQWLEDEQLMQAVAPSELAFLFGSASTPSHEEQGRPEAIFTLAWAASLVSSPLDFVAPCPPTLIDSVPHPPPRPNTVADARARTRLQPIDDLVAALDLAYCLHWALVDARLHAREPSGSVQEWIIVERRRALEWLVGRDDWDEVDLST